MHLIHLRMNKPSAEDVKYVNTRLSSQYKAKQILPTLWITFETFNNLGNVIDSNLICETLKKIRDELEVRVNWFVTAGDYDDSQWMLPKEKSKWLKESNEASKW